MDRSELVETLSQIKKQIEEKKQEITALKKQEHLIKTKCLISKMCQRLKINDPKKLPEKNIQHIQIHTNEHEWCITYLHKTLHFNCNNYVNDDEKQLNIKDRERETLVKFGYKKKKHYIHGFNKKQFRIYKNSSGITRVINTYYNLELTFDEQHDLIEQYSQNINIPEWFALKMYLYFADNQWDNDAIKKFLTTF